MRLMERIKSGVYTIAEMSATHAGSIENALDIVRAAKKAGADCLKTQTYTADTITLDSDRECFRINEGLWKGETLYGRYGRAYTPWDWQARIKEECDHQGIDFLSSPFDDTAVDFLEDIGVSAYKIASFELVDIPLIKYAAGKGKPLIISTGMGSVEEIREAVDACLGEGNKDIVLLKCTSEYPAVYSDMNLRTIEDMRERFGVPVGLSDHSMGSIAPVVAVSLGACVIEKHFCLSRGMENADSAFSMEPEEFAEMVSAVKKAYTVRGEVCYTGNREEEASKKLRRSLFVSRDIAAGGLMTRENAGPVRPADGIAPKHLGEVLGKRASRDLTRGEPLDWDMFE
jgi:pseudaminic acid synthase